MWFSEKKLQVSVSDKKLQVQFQIRNCNFQRQSIYINTAFSNRVNIMLEVLFMVENGTTSQLTSCWSTFMHSTSSYDAQSKRYAIFKMPTQCRVCEHRENEGRSFGKCWTWFWAAPSRLSFLTCAAHDLGWEVHRPVCIFLRSVMYRPAYGPPIRGFLFPETSTVGEQITVGQLIELQIIMTISRQWSLYRHHVQD